MARTRLSVAIVAPVAIVIVAAGLRLWGVTSPPQPYWDEQYYVYDASAYLGGGFGVAVHDAPSVRIADEGTWVHPPLGKWILALLGIGPLGMNALGWRLPSVLFGVAGVLLVYLIAMQLWRSVLWASVASGLLAIEGLHIVQSRIAMLDIFMSTFVLAGILFLVRDRNRMDEGDPSSSRFSRIFGSRDRALAGAMFGAAVACKWAGIFALAFAIVLVLVWTSGDRRGEPRSPRRSISTIATSLIGIPLVVYLVSYGAFWFQHGPAVSDFLVLQLRMLEYHQAHTQIQPENSPPWTWPLLLHPVQYFPDPGEGSTRAIVALGNPVIWWGFLALLPVSIVAAIRRPDWRDAVVFGGAMACFVPWLFVGRSQFLYYMLPVVPFMCLGIASTLRHLSDGRIGRTTGYVVIGAALATAVLFLPIWIGLDVPSSWRDLLAWLPQWPG